MRSAAKMKPPLRIGISTGALPCRLCENMHGACESKCSKVSREEECARQGTAADSSTTANSQAGARYDAACAQHPVCVPDAREWYSDCHLHANNCKQPITEGREVGLAHHAPGWMHGVALGTYPTSYVFPSSFPISTTFSAICCFVNSTSPTSSWMLYVAADAAAAQSCSDLSVTAGATLMVACAIAAA